MRDQTTTVRVDELEDGIVAVVLDRPDRLNAMNLALIDDLHAALEEIDGRREVRAVILTGSGRGFCAGLDLIDSAPTMIEADAAQQRRGRVQRGMELQQRIAALIPRMRRLRVPIIAAVNGPAAGGGLALVLGSDIRIGAASSRYGVAFVRIGLSGCDIGVSWALPRLIGASRAHELMLTGRVIDSEEAERIGLVVRVVADDQLMAGALDMARAVARNSPFGVQMTKEAMWSALEIPQQAAIDLENRQQILASLTEDMAEAVGAFLGKRPAIFRDR
jgi:enoyl-CoA hydratase